MRHGEGATQVAPSFGTVQAGLCFTVQGALQCVHIGFPLELSGDTARQFPSLIEATCGQPLATQWHRQHQVREGNGVGWNRLRQSRAQHGTQVHGATVLELHDQPVPGRGVVHGAMTALQRQRVDQAGATRLQAPVAAGQP